MTERDFLRRSRLLTFSQSVRKSEFYGTSLALHRPPMASVDIVSPTEADVRRRSQMEQYFQQMKRLLQYQRRGAYNGSNWLGLVRIQTSSHDFNEREILIVI